VSEHFTNILHTVNFKEEALKFKSLDSWLTPARHVTESLVFNAYFVDEPEFELLRHKCVKL
jgi:hypothetical protein